MLENLKLGFIILLAGVVIVFCVLILLIGIIKLYSELVVTVQNTFKKKTAKKKKSVTREDVEPQPVVKQEVVAEPAVKSDDDSSIPLEVIAAIAAAATVVFGEGAVQIKSVKRSSKRRSAWKSAGVAENTRSF